MGDLWDVSESVLACGLFVCGLIQFVKQPQYAHHAQICVWKHAKCIGTREWTVVITDSEARHISLWNPKLR